VSKIDQRQLALRYALARVSGQSPWERPVPSCKGRMIEAVVRAVGPEGASTAEVYGELVDLAVLFEIAKTDAPMGEAVISLVSEFQADCIEIVVAAFRRSARQCPGAAT
jgi:hypothetical protein